MFLHVNEESSRDYIDYLIPTIEYQRYSNLVLTKVNRSIAGSIVAEITAWVAEIGGTLVRKAPITVHEDMDELMNNLYSELGLPYQSRSAVNPLIEDQNDEVVYDF